MPLRLAVLGPAGRWRVVGRRGIASVSAMSGRMNDTLTVTPRADSLRDWQITLEYKGALAVTPRGAIVAPGTPMRFSFGTFEPAQEWDVKFFVWSDSTDPRGKAGGFAALLRGAPVATRARAPARLHVVPADDRGAAAGEVGARSPVVSVTLAPGAYTLRTISDDAVRVWVDGKLAIDDWKPHESAVDVAPLSAGRHELLVQYFQVDGWTELRLDIVRGKEMASGSPGPH